MYKDLPHAAFAADSPPDIAARRRALNPQESFAVSAPAGSGKTGLLTQRVLTLLAHCDEPEEILAITFTRKAAGEMQERILQALWSAKETPEPEDHHRRITWQLARQVIQRDGEKHWQLLLNPQRLRIQTIDALCRAITRQMPLASGLGAQPNTLNDADAAYRLAVRNFFLLLEQDTPLREDLARLLRHLDNNLSLIENLLVALLAKREQWLQVLLEARADTARHYLESVLQQVISEHLQRLQRYLVIHQSEICDIADKAASNLRDEAPQKHCIASLLAIAALPTTTPEDLAQWRALADLLLTNTGNFRVKLTKNEGFPPGATSAPLKQKFAALVAQLQETLPDIAQQLHEVRHLPPPRYTEEQWQMLDSLTRLLPLLVAQLTLVFKQLGATDYSAISQAALQALGEEEAPTDVALQLDYRIRHILVDEFQDTASPQLQLLQKLTAGWQPGDGRTLFIVGDGMQSCYGFRNANVGLFLDARRHGIGSVSLTPIDLQVNFRSQSGVIKWINSTFCQAFPAENDIGRGAVSYFPSIAFKPELTESPVNFWGCVYASDTEVDEESAAANSANADRELAQWQEAQTVVQLVEQDRARYPDETIAILVRNRSHLVQVIGALKAAGLRWQATDIDSLASRMAIIDLLSLTRALLNPADRIAWLAILRAPWCGLDLYDLFHLVNTDLGTLSPRPQDGDYPVIWQQLLQHQAIGSISQSGQRCLERLLQVLQPAWQQRQRKPLRQWIEGIWLALGGPAVLLDQQDHDNIHSFFILLERHEEGGQIGDWQAFAQAVNALYAAPAADGDPHLQVMTIHKAKGLEFDTVIIPALDRLPRKDDHELLLWQERLDAQGQRQLLLGPLAATGEDHNDLYLFMREEKDKQQRYEATRLLYVGCTRAIKRLHLLACVKSKKDELVEPGKTSLLASIWSQVKAQMQTPPRPKSTLPNVSITAKDRPGLQHIVRLAPHWQPPELPDPALLANYRGREYDDEENLPEVETKTRRLARQVGTILHRALQNIVESGLLVHLLDEGTATFLQQQQPFWRMQLKAFGWRGEELSQAVEKISLGINRTLTDPQGQWLLDNRHLHSACELSLYRQSQGALREAVIDRTFVSDGVRWIIDYKSSEPVPGQTLEDFVCGEIQAYAAQLMRYRDCFAAMETTTIKTALYFPLLEYQRWVEVTAPITPA